MDWPVPFRVTVLVPGVKAPPLLVQLWLTLMLVALPALRVVPEPMAKEPFKFRVVIELPKGRALVPDVVRL